MEKRLVRLSLRVCQALVSVGVLAYLVSLLDLASIQRLHHLNLLYQLWPAPLILIFGYVIAALRWRFLLGHLGIVISRVSAFCMYLFGGFYAVLLPGVLGGDAVRVALCASRTRASISRIVFSIGIERSLGLLGLTLLGSISLLALEVTTRELLGSQVLLIYPAVGAGGVLTLGILYLAMHLFARFPLETELGWRRYLVKLQIIVAQVRSIPPRVLGTTLVLSTLFQASDILIFAYLGTVLKIDVPLVLYFSIVPIVYFATVLPISLGGIGVREGVLTWLLTKVGVLGSDAVLLAFLVSLNRIIVSLIGGAAAWLEPCRSKAT